MAVQEGPKNKQVINANYKENYVNNQRRLYRFIEQIINNSVIAQDVFTPPVSPSQSDAYFLPMGSTLTGAWEGLADDNAVIVSWQTGVTSGIKNTPVTPYWEIDIPNEGWPIYVTGDQMYVVTADGTLASIGGNQFNQDLNDFDSVQFVNLFTTGYVWALGFMYCQGGQGLRIDNAAMTVSSAARSTTYKGGYKFSEIGSDDNVSDVGITSSESIMLATFFNLTNGLGGAFGLNEIDKRAYADWTAHNQSWGAKSFVVGNGVNSVEASGTVDSRADCLVAFPDCAIGTVIQTATGKGYRRVADAGVFTDFERIPSTATD